MGTHRLLLVFFFLLAVSSAQQTGPAQNDKFTVEGTVVNSATGKPLPRVLVQLAGRSVLSGPEGEFSFDGLSAGDGQIVLTKPGYFAPGASDNSFATSVEIGPDTAKLTLKFAPEAVVYGQVTGQDDEPLEGAIVDVLAFNKGNSRSLVDPLRRSARTDEDGNFRLAGVPSGRYYLVVKAGSVARRVLGAQAAKTPAAYPPITYYPAASDMAAATVVSLAPGQRMEVQFSLALVPAYKQAGKVVATGEWKRLTSPLILGPMGDPLFGADQFDPQSGSFEFRAVAAGTYTVRVGGTDSTNRYRFSEHKIAVTHNVGNLQLSLKPGVNIPVVIRTDFSKPQEHRSCAWSGSGGEVHRSDCSDFPAARVELVSLDSVRLRFSTEYAAMEAPADLALRGVAPGKYKVQPWSMLGGYVQSARSGSVDLLHEWLSVPEEGTVAPIEIVLRDDPGTLKVAVRAEKSGQHATIVVFPDGAIFPEQNIMGTVGTQPSMMEVAPGTYKVFAFDSLDGVDYRNPEALAKYGSMAASVTVPANGTASVIVDLIHNGE